MAQVHRLLNALDELVVLICRVVAQDVHVETRALLDHRQPNAPGANNCNRLSGDLVAEEGKIRMPESPFVFQREVLGRPEPPRQVSHDEECELRGGLSQHIGCIRERDLVAVGVGPIDVVEADRQLRNDFQRAFAGFEDLGIDLIPQSRDQAINAGTYLFEKQGFWRCLRVGINLKLIPMLTQHIQRRTNIAGSKYAKVLAHKTNLFLVLKVMQNTEPQRSQSTPRN